MVIAFEDNAYIEGVSGRILLALYSNLFYIHQPCYADLRLQFKTDACVYGIGFFRQMPLKPQVQGMTNTECKQLDS